MTIIEILPHLQATLNLTAVSLMTIGYYYIRKQNKAAHRACMIAALVVSTLFLVAYIYYHFHVGNVKFAGQGIIRPIYFSILASHILLAALIVPLILVTLRYAFGEKFIKHRRIARWTLPLWLYVSITGIIVYLLAFHFYPPAALI
jgi:uncharacterized membrane protein YozB (DUF420 family)